MGGSMDWTVAATIIAGLVCASIIFEMWLKREKTVVSNDNETIHQLRAEIIAKNGAIEMWKERGDRLSGSLEQAIKERQQMHDQSLSLLKNYGEIQSLRNQVAELTKSTKVSHDETK